jgi:crotonobetainyl-CoA:carnitine CoA-transferase CaiB-like acyl-CoA transferase
MAQNTKKRKNSTRPLEGIKIVEYGIWHAGPGGNAILGDLGAEIIKVETLEGDPERRSMSLGAVRFDKGAPPGWSFLYEWTNRNKKGIILDIKTAKGREIFDRLIKDTDVFATNLRNSTKPKLKIDYASISKINPKIVYASVSGFGTKGPMRDIGAFDPLGQSVSGMAWIAGTEEPFFLHAAILDQMTAIASSHAILTALLVRERQGIGQEVHVSLYSSALWLMQANFLAASLLDMNAGQRWDRSQNPVLRNSFRCKDGKWIMGTNHRPEVWKTFCEVTGQLELADDPRFADEESRNKNINELVSIYDKVFLTKNRDEWVHIFLKHNLMYTPVQTIAEVLNDVQAKDNCYVLDHDHPHFGKVKMPGYAVQFSKSKLDPWTLAPTLGQHTDEVLGSIGYSREEVKKLRQDKVIQ